MNSSTSIGVCMCSTFLSALLVVTLGGCSEYASPDVQAMKDTVVKFKEEKSAVDRSLVKFDEMDFNAIARRRWEPFSGAHVDSVIVNWPDGHSTKGIAAHILEARALLAFAPDAWVEAHPISFGTGEWTCVTSTVSGTFTNPMRTATGKCIQATGKRFRISVCTIARWKDHKIVEKSLYWDNQALMNQLGLAGSRAR